MNELLIDSHWPRKIFHVTGASIIPTVHYFDLVRDDVTLLVTGVAALIWITFDTLRLRSKAVNEFFVRNLSFLMKTRESEGYTGTSFLLVGSFLTLLFFQPVTASVVLFFLAFGDPSAAVIGKRFGKIRFANGRSLEGSATMFAVCVLVGLTLADFSLSAMLTGAFTATLAEAFSGRLDDNFSIPLFSGAAIAGLGG